MDQGEHVRPTHRVLRSLDIEPPSVAVALHHLGHPLVAEAQKLPSYVQAGSAQRIRSLTDRVWFKEKTGRWRGAVTRFSEDECDRWRHQLRLHSWWLCAVGCREEGSSHDFYAALQSAAERHGSAKHPSSDFLLPDDWDVRRLTVELEYAWIPAVESVLLRLIAQSLRSGEVLTARFKEFELTACVRADRGNEAYLMVASSAAIDPNRFAVILDLVPGVTKNDWQPEPGGAMGVEPRAGFVVWSSILPPCTADAILKRFPDEGDC